MNVSVGTFHIWGQDETVDSELMKLFFLSSELKAFIISTKERFSFLLPITGLIV